MNSVDAFNGLILYVTLGNEASVMQQRPKHQSVSSSSIREPLSVENYKKKFTQLIEVEREEHRGYLKQR